MAVDKEPLDAQRKHWEATFSDDPEKFGVEPSYPAQKAAEIFRNEGKTKILELGGGQGRDTLFFARSGFQVHVVDYSELGLAAIARNAERAGLSRFVKTLAHDVREALPFADESFDACYSHMLYCMALTEAELGRLSGEVGRILKPNGLNVYTVRNTSDPDYGTGIHRGEDMYEVDGYVVHFFSRENIKRLTGGCEVVGIEGFQEGGLPKELFLVTLRKPSSAG